MKKTLVYGALFGLYLNWGCQGQSQGTAPSDRELLFRSHFVGSAQLGGNTNGAKLREIWALPATAAFREVVMQRLSAACPQTFAEETAASAAEQAKLFRPLLDDFVTAESFVEVHGPSNKLEFAAALKLDDARAGLWFTNLSKVMAAAKAGGPHEIKGEGFRGSEWRKKSAPAVFRTARAGQWLVVGGGPEQLKLHAGLLQRVVQTGRPTLNAGRDWLEVDVDTALVRAWVPFQGRQPTPMAHLTVNGKGENLLAHMRLKYAQPLGWVPEPWNVPTNLIRDPIISFTAARGISPLLGSLQGVSELGLKPLPSQMFSWAYNSIPYSTHLAFPIVDATNVVRRIQGRASDMLRAQLGKSPSGQFVFRTNTAELSWKGLPIFAPSLRPLRNGVQEYLGLSFFPPPANTNLPPPTLFAEVTRTPNLAFYGWEITESRITNWRQFYQMADILAGRRMQSQTAPIFKWLIAIGPHLANAVTEITVTAPDELSLLREAHIGLTGFDLVTLTRWVDSPRFPFTFDPPPAFEVPKAPKKGN
ncbi:MAG TPA: hypothetical protein VGK40_11725 [Verrucomicrobiae bacterium]|jgi:hypothetical protein